MTWLWVENESYAGQTPRILTAACHDGSPFVTIRCSCDSEAHIHESQLADVSPFDAIGMPCRSCGNVLRFEPSQLQAYFSDLRRRGWIA